MACLPLLLRINKEREEKWFCNILVLQLVYNIDCVTSLLVPGGTTGRMQVVHFYFISLL
jgi:hypothetical protein